MEALPKTAKACHPWLLGLRHPWLRTFSRGPPCPYRSPAAESKNSELLSLRVMSGGEGCTLSRPFRGCAKPGMAEPKQPGTASFCGPRYGLLSVHPSASREQIYSAGKLRAECHESYAFVSRAGKLQASHAPWPEPEECRQGPPLPACRPAPAAAGHCASHCRSRNPPARYPAPPAIPATG